MLLEGVKLFSKFIRYFLASTPKTFCCRLPFDPFHSPLRRVLPLKLQKSSLILKEKGRLAVPPDRFT